MSHVPALFTDGTWKVLVNCWISGYFWRNEYSYKQCHLLYISNNPFHDFSTIFLFYFVVVVQSLSHVQLLVTPWTAAHQASLSFTISQTLLKLMSIQSVMLANHLILCRLLLFLTSIFPSIEIFSSESNFRIGWPKYWSFSFSISLSNEYSVLVLWLCQVLIVACVIFTAMHRLHSACGVWAPQVAPWHVIS